MAKAPKGPVTGGAGHRTPPEVLEEFSAAEQAHIDSAGDTPIGAARAIERRPADQEEQVEEVAETEAEVVEEEAAAEGEGDEAAETVDGEEAAAEGEQQPDKRTVPLAALHQSRQELKAAKERQTLLESQLATLSERTTRILETFAQRDANAATVTEAAAGPKAPDPNTHPLEYLLHQVDSVVRDVANLKGGEAKRQEETIAQRQLRQLGETAVMAERQYIATHPEYNDASVFLQNSRIEELRELGLNDQQITQQMTNEGLQIAKIAQDQKKNPAEIIHNLAKRRGFVAKKASPNGARPAAADVVRTVARGQAEAGPTLARASGRGPVPLTAERLLEMSDADYDRAIATQAGRALLG